MKCSHRGPDVRKHLALPPMDFCGCFLREASTKRTDPRYRPSSATERSFRLEKVLTTSRLDEHGTSGQRRLNASWMHASHAARRFRTSDSGSAPLYVQTRQKVVA